MSVKPCLRTLRSVILCVVFLLGYSSVAVAQKGTSSQGESVNAAVGKALAGLMPVEHACPVIKTGDIDMPSGGKTPIYLVMDYLATHPKGECQVAEQLLEAFLSRSDFNINQRYRSLLPPFAYLIRTNYSHLGGHFSADYISDNVLKMLIGAGARVNTYNTDGGSLMSFALETDNQYLQSYFVEKGINLRHEDKAGNDDVYKLIADGNLQTLRQAIDKGSVTLTIEALKNDTKDIARFPELYDYLAQKCASAATEYSSLKEFRQRFSDRKTLVQGKWETMAQAECNAAKDFDAVMTVEGRFPDLAKIVEPVKLRIYKRDCEKLQQSNQKAQPYLRGQSTNYKVDDYPLEFCRIYMEKYHYDPENKMGLAGHLVDFNEVLKGLTTPTNTTYWQNEEFILGLVVLGVDLDVKRAEADQKAIAHAISIVESSSRYPDDYCSFFKRVTPDLYRSREEMKRNIDRNNREYQAAYEAFKRDQAAAEAEAAARRAKKEAEERERNKFSCTVHLVDSKGRPRRYGKGWATFHKGEGLIFEKTTSVSFEVDGDGNAIIELEEGKDYYIKTISATFSDTFFSKDSGEGELKLVKGGNYTVVLE